MPQLTVAICTYRRRDLLKITLESLCAAAQHVPRLDWELLIIDNADEPSVASLVQSFAHRFPCVRYEIQPTPGTSWARNLAVETAQSPIIVFTDDDVTFDPQWLARMSHAITCQPQCQFWGGRVEPHWPADLAQPSWFNPTLCPMLGDTIVQYRRGDQPRPWNSESDPPFYTANLAFRVTAVQNAGGFNTAVGHSASKRVGMEDSLMVYAIASAGGQGWYAGDAVVHHPVPHDRITKSYCRNFAKRQGWLSVYLLQLQSPNHRVPRWLYRLALQRTMTNFCAWIKHTFTRRPDHAFACQIQFLFNASKFWHALLAIWKSPPTPPTTNASSPTPTPPSSSSTSSH